MMTPENDLEYMQLPEHLREGMKRYIEERIEPGKFLMSVLSNDLTNACFRCDPQHLLVDIVRWVYNEAPSTCWGSPDKVKGWLWEGHHAQDS